MEEFVILTPNGEKLLRFLQENDKVWVGKDLVEATGIKGVYTVLNSLMNKSLVMEEEIQYRPFTNKKGITSVKPYKTYSLTEKGRGYTLPGGWISNN